MPAPSVATYAAAVKVAAHTAFLALVDGGSGAGLIRIRDSGDVLLAECTCSDPAGTVNGTTGTLTFSAVTSDSSANNSGTAAYGEICDSDGDVLLSLPAQAGGTAVSGKIVLNTLTIAAGGPVAIVSVVVG
mgnify:FL=1